MDRDRKPAWARLQQTSTHLQYVDWDRFEAASTEGAARPRRWSRAAASRVARSERVSVSIKP